MTPASPRLTEVRSQRAEAVLRYLAALRSELGRTPLLERFGRTLDDVRIPLRVVRFEPERDHQEAVQTERLRPSSRSRRQEGQTVKRTDRPRGSAMPIAVWKTSALGMTRPGLWTRSP